MSDRVWGPQPEGPLGMKPDCEMSDRVWGPQPEGPLGMKPDFSDPAMAQKAEEVHDRMLRGIPMHELADRMGEPLLRWFETDERMPQPVMRIAQLYATLAREIILGMRLPRSAERTVALRQLLASKDAAVRAAIETCLR